MGNRLVNNIGSPPPPYGKSVCVDADNRKFYATPIRIPYYTNTKKSRPLNALYPNNCGGFIRRINNPNPSKQRVDIICEPISAMPQEPSRNMYHVQNGHIDIRGERHPICLPDGFYVIRKLTINECRRLQTIPDWYDTSCISDLQAYKCLGNGWTIDVISHLLSHIPDIRNHDVEVLSLYDGMACGMIALQNLGVNVTKYTAYEIDRFAIKVASHNFPKIIQRGDAFQIREADWSTEI